ncbi:hypothetical protein Dimus_020383, partial [Dionaea muscipula]
KKDVARSKVRGVEIVFDHLKLASILGVPGNIGIYQGGCRSGEKFYDAEDEVQESPEIGTAGNRRRDDEIEAPEEEAEEKVEAQNDFDWEAVIDEVADQGDSGSGEKFYDAEDEVQESPEVNDEIPAVTKVTEAAGVDPSGPSGHLPETVMNKLQDEFERARADRIQADLEKAQAENGRLLALLQQAQNPPKPKDFFCKALTRPYFVLNHV